jgi:hypothetical protein
MVVTRPICRRPKNAAALGAGPLGTATLSGSQVKGISRGIMAKSAEGGSGLAAK